MRQKLEDVREKVKPGYRFIQYPDSKWGPYHWEVVRLIERGVVAQMYSHDWQKQFKGHQHIVEWSATIEEVG